MHLFPSPTKQKACAILAAVLLLIFVLWRTNANAAADEPPASVAEQITWPIAAILIALVLALAFRFRRPSPVPAVVPSPPKALSHRELSQRFVSAIPSLTPETNLEIATATITELIERTDSREAFWGCLDLGTNLAQIRVPMTYRYHVRLYDSWHLEQRGGTLYVLAPALRASLPPALHTEGLEQRTSRGWLRFPPTSLMETLHRDLTPTLVRFAEDPARLKLIRETCRDSIQEFVTRWAGQEKLAQTIARIEVRFADERAVSAGKPTRRLLS